MRFQASAASGDANYASQRAACEVAGSAKDFRWRITVGQVVPVLVGYVCVWGAIKSKWQNVICIFMTPLNGALNIAIV